MVYEQHDFIGPPLTCRPSENETANGTIITVELASLWVNDTELAAFLKQTYPGMPVHYSAITTKTEAIAPGILAHTWSWGLGPHNRSSLTALDDQQQSPDAPLRDRLFWHNETGVAFMDLETRANTPKLTDRIANGTFYPPMLWGYIQPDYVSSGEWQTEVSMTGSIRVFKDHECKQPA